MSVPLYITHSKWQCHDANSNLSLAHGSDYSLHIVSFRTRLQSQIDCVMIMCGGCTLSCTSHSDFWSPTSEWSLKRLFTQDVFFLEDLAQAQYKILCELVQFTGSDDFLFQGSGPSKSEAICHSAASQGLVTALSRISILNKLYWKPLFPKPINCLGIWRCVDFKKPCQIIIDDSLPVALTLYPQPQDTTFIQLFPWLD